MHTETSAPADGIYGVYYSGKMSLGNALLCMEDGKITGMDHYSGKIDGTYTQNADGNVDIAMTYYSPPGFPFATGKTAPVGGMFQDIEGTWPAHFWDGQTIRLETPTGPLKALFLPTTGAKTNGAAAAEKPAYHSQTKDGSYLNGMYRTTFIGDEVVGGSALFRLEDGQIDGADLENRVFSGTYTEDAHGMLHVVLTVQYRSQKKELKTIAKDVAFRVPVNFWHGGVHNYIDTPGEKVRAICGKVRGKYAIRW